MWILLSLLGALMLGGAVAVAEVADSMWLPLPLLFVGVFIHGLGSGMNGMKYARRA